jgi:hypothetical protein
MPVYTNISAVWSDVGSKALGCDCHCYRQISFPVGRCGAKIQFLNFYMLQYALSQSPYQILKRSVNLSRQVASSIPNITWRYI